MSIACEISAVSYRIGGLDLVSDVSFDLMPGEVVSLIGPNGAGKSTLLRLIAGDIKFSSGSIKMASTDLHKIPIKDLAQIRAVMSQAPDLTFPFRVEEVIALGIDGIANALSRARRSDTIQNVANRADIVDLIGRYYQTLSGGEAQRVQFARALAQLEVGKRHIGQQFLFLDEPVSSLDVVHQWELMDNVRRVAHAGVCVLVILHDINLAAAYSDRIAVLKKGKLKAIGAPDEILSDDLIYETFSIQRREEVNDNMWLQITPQTHRPAHVSIRA